MPSGVANQIQEQYRANGCRHKGSKKAIRGKPQQAKNEAAEKSAYDPNADVADQSESMPAGEFSRQPAGQCADDQKVNYSVDRHIETACKSPATSAHGTDSIAFPLITNAIPSLKECFSRKISRNEKADIALVSSARRQVINRVDRSRTSVI
jgi:hypothetical protein